MKNKKQNNGKGRRDRRKKNDPYSTAVRNAMTGYIGQNGTLGKLARVIEAGRKPRLLIVDRRGGKTSIVAKSGLTHDFTHRAERLTNENESIRWFFSEKAAYIDARNVQTGWEAFCRALKKHKFPRRRAVDGLIFVIDTREFLSMGKARSDQLAGELRELADTLVLAIGYEFPAYFVFAGTDGVEGFRELFSDKVAIERMPVIGSLVCGDDSARPAPEAFSARYKKIFDDLTDLCLLKMIDIGGVEKSGPLCRLSSEFMLAEPKLSAFLSEFFKYRGRAAPRFRGFFFTSGKAGETCAFSNRVLGEVIPNAGFDIREADAGTAAYWVKKAFSHLLKTAACAALIFGVAGSGLRDALYMRSLEAELSSLLEDEPTLENQYAALEKLRVSYEHLRGGAGSPGRLVFGAGRAREKIRDAYVAASSHVMVAPAAKRLETEMSRRRPDALAAEEHQSLYRLLKTYLLLTGGNRVTVDDFSEVAEIFEQSLRSSLGGRHRKLNDRVIKDNVNAVIDFAAAGFYDERADQNIIRSARERLTAAPSANAVYRAVMDKLRAHRRHVPVERIFGGSDMIRYGHNISVLYTREEWDGTIREEFINAAKDPFRADWVMGPVKARIDEEKLLAELVSLYGDDLCRRWLDFIRNAQVSLPADLPSLARDLERLSSRESETRRMLAAICSLVAREEPEPLRAKSAAGLKGQITNVSNRLRGGADNAARDLPDPFVEAKKVFGVIENFLNGGAFDDYQKTLGALSEKIRDCDARGGFTQTFAIRGDDPLKLCRNSLSSAYLNMPSAVSASLKRVLELPLDFTAGVIAGKITTEIEESWASEVASRYSEKLAGRYPLDKTGNDLSWSDFEEFFKPQSGILWSYYDKNLSGLMERTHRGYERRPRRAMSVSLAVSDNALNCYNRAVIIANGFFGNDGTRRRLDVNFYPFRSSSGETQFMIGDRHLDFRGGLPVSVNGNVADEEIVLRLITSDRAQEELRFRGEWSLMRFANAGNVEKVGGGRYRVTWRVNVRNIYTANVMTVIQSNAEALFDESVMRGFAVPGKILSAEN